jgi:subtilisin
MPRRTTLFLNLGLILSLVFSGTLSGILIPSPVAIGASNAPTISPENGGPELASRRVKRQRRHDRAQNDRQQHRKQKDKKRDHKKDSKQKERTQDRSGPVTGSEVNVEDHYIVVLKHSADNPAQAARDMAIDGVEPSYVYEHVLDGFAAVIPDDQLDDVRADPRVQSVVPDREVHAFDQTLPTGIDRIDADQNLTAKIGSGQMVDVDVAVIDTGIGPHEDLNIAADGVSCISGTTNPADDNGHGTHVAGTIGALDNTAGVVGVAPGARLWAVKVLNSAGSGSWSSVICGLDWVAARSGTIEVVNMSLGGPGSDSGCPGTDALHDAIRKVVNAGVPVVVAAGNGVNGVGLDAKDSVPAAYDEVFTVSALADFDGKPSSLVLATPGDSDDSLASFSNFGADIDIAAPGVDILSTVPSGSCKLCQSSGYRKLSGTSMASPHVAGAAALYLANFPNATPVQVQAVLVSTREAVALTNDGDGIAEGVLFAGIGSAPSPPAASPVPTPSCATVASAPVQDDGSQDDGKKDKKKHKHKKKKRH